MWQWLDDVMKQVSNSTASVSTIKIESVEFLRKGSRSGAIFRIDVFGPLACGL